MMIGIGLELQHAKARWLNVLLKFEID